MTVSSPSPSSHRYATGAVAPSHLRATGPVERLDSRLSVQAVLEGAARSAADTLGFQTAVVTVHRPVFDDFQVATVIGSEEIREALLGRIFGWDELESVFALGEHATGRSGPRSGSPKEALTLFAPLPGASGNVVGAFSLKDPLHPNDPVSAKRTLLSDVAEQAGLLLEEAQRTEISAMNRRAQEHLLRVSGQLTARLTIDEMVDAACFGIREALGYRKVVMAWSDSENKQDVLAAIGASDEQIEAIQALTLADIEPLFADVDQSHGCVLLGAADAKVHLPGALVDFVDAEGATDDRPNIWHGDRILLGLYRQTGDLTGFLLLESPHDPLPPPIERLQALRAFVNHATSAVESARQLETMRHLAEHDPLTGLRNRRGLQERIDLETSRAGPTGVIAVIICDLDHFKRTNDLLGYEVGDKTLQHVAQILRGICGWAGVAARLGGEEFALVLPEADKKAAFEAGERVRRAVDSALEDAPVPLTISVGVAVAGLHGDDAGELLRSANRALFWAKRLGRDRSVIYDADAFEELGIPLDDEDVNAGEQLAAAMLLAETLDIRDFGTAAHSQTVGRYTREVARYLEWKPARIHRMHAAGVLHDIGKLGVADAVLLKQGPLTDDEWAEMRRHPELGARILQHANLRDISEWVLRHHERPDGRGYPEGLAGDMIPVEARILAIADAYEAMTANRPYRKALSHAKARDELLRHAGTQFDAEMVEAFLKVLDSGSFERRT